MADPFAPKKRSATYYGNIGTRGSIDPRDFAQRMPTSFGESIDTSFEQAYGETAFALDSDFFSEYDSYIKELNELTGRSLANPYIFSPPRPGARKQDERDKRVRRFHSQVAELARDHPDVPLRSHTDIVSAVQARLQDVRERRAAAAAGEAGFGSGLAVFLGSSAGVLLDPVVLPTLFMGAPWSAGVLRFALTEAALGAGSAAVSQARFQASRREIGEEPDFGRVAESALVAGVGGGVLGGVVRGVGKGIGALRSRRARLEAAEQLPPERMTPDVEAAIAAERRILEIEETNPFGPDIRGQRLHAERYAAAERAAADGHSLPSGAPDEVFPDMPDLPDIENTRAHRLEADRDRQALGELADLANDDPAQFAARIESLRAVPREAAQASRDLPSGAVAVPEGVTVPRGLEVVEADAQGSPTAVRLPDKPDLPKRADFTSREEFEQARDAHRQAVKDHRKAEAFIEKHKAARVALAPNVSASVMRQARVLDRIGVNVRELSPDEVAARVRAIQPDDIDAVDGEALSRSEARASASVATTAAEREAELDELREEQVRQAFLGREDERVMIEDEDGIVRPFSVREIFEEAEREAADIEAIKLCMFGAVRRG